jgi:hypothetical protein
LVVVAIYGGGVEIKEVKIPTLPGWSRALSALFGCSLLALALFRPQMLTVPSAPESKPSVDAINKPSDAAKGPFDGRWEGTEAGWRISGTVTDGTFVGNIDFCVRTHRDNSRADNVARIRGQIYPDGTFLGVTEPFSRPQEVRDISGHFPNIKIQARYPAEVGCDDVSLMLQRSSK